MINCITEEFSRKNTISGLINLRQEWVGFKVSLFVHSSDQKSKMSGTWVKQNRWRRRNCKILVPENLEQTVLSILSTDFYLDLDLLDDDDDDDDDEDRRLRRRSLDLDDDDDDDDDELSDERRRRRFSRRGEADRERDDDLNVAGGCVH